MKRKFLVVFLTIAAVFCMAFGLAGCDLFGNNSDVGDNGDVGNNPSTGHTHSYGE